MKRYIKFSDSIITKADFKGALLALKISNNPVEIEKAQQVIREYTAKNPELAEKVKAEFNAPRPRAPRSKTPKDPKTFTSRHMR